MPWSCTWQNLKDAFAANTQNIERADVIIDSSGRSRYFPLLVLLPHKSDQTPFVCRTAFSVVDNICIFMVLNDNLHGNLREFLVSEVVGILSLSQVMYGLDSHLVKQIPLHSGNARLF